MKYSIIILSFLFIISCGNNSTGVSVEDEFEPFQIGNWLVTSPTTAELVDTGGNDERAEAVVSQASADTVRITSLNDVRLTLEQDPTNPNNAILTYVDSTVVFSDETRFINVSLDMQDYARDLTGAATSVDLDPERLLVKNNIFHSSCKSGLEFNSTTITQTISVQTNPGESEIALDILKVVEIDVEGFDLVIFDLVCEN